MTSCIVEVCMRGHESHFESCQTHLWRSNDKLIVAADSCRGGVLWQIDVSSYVVVQLALTFDRSNVQVSYCQLLLLLCNIFMHSPPIIGVERYYAFGSSVSPSVRTLSVNSYFAWLDISVRSWWISMKLGISVRHVSRQRCKSFYGHRSKVKIVARPDAIFRQRHRG